MSLDIWFREDIRHILMAAERASDVALALGEESAADAGALRAYRRGYQAALSAIALACGLTPVEDAQARRPATPPRAGEMGSHAQAKPRLLGGQR